MKNVITEYHLTGPCHIDINRAVEQWDGRAAIFDWENDKEESYRLIVALRKNSREATSIKATISKEQAFELIAKLHLTRQKGFFNSSGVWRREQDHKYL